MDRMSARKKKIQGFPMFFTFENFKNSLNGLSKAVVGSFFVVIIVAAIVVVADLKSKRNCKVAKGKVLVMVRKEKNKMLGRGGSPFVRLRRRRIVAIVNEK
jgi:hypothetical protein